MATTSPPVPGMPVVDRDESRATVLPQSGAGVYRTTAAAAAALASYLGDGVEVQLTDVPGRPLAVWDGYGYVPPLSSVANKNTVILAGDSMLERSFATASAISGVDNGDGTATLTFGATPLSSTTQTAPGDIIRVNNASAPKLNQLAATVLSVTTSAPYTVTYTTTGPYSPMVGGNPPFIVLERSRQCLSLYPLLNFLAGGELVLEANCTQGGAALAEVTAQWDKTVGPKGTVAKFGLFMCGRNDIFARGFSYAQTIAAAKGLLDRMIHRVRHLIVFTTPPQDSTLLGATWTLAKFQAQLQYETWLKQYAHSIGAIVIDSGAVTSGTEQYRNASSSNGDPTAGWFPTGDGTHQNSLSSYALAKAAYAQMSKYIVPTIAWPSSVAATNANDPSMVTDSFMLTGTGGTPTPGSGTITGSVPDGVTVQIASGTGAVTLSSIARTVANDGDATGNWLRATITNTTGSTTVNITLALNVARVTNGDILRALSRIRISSSATPGSGAPIGLTQFDAICRVLTNTTLYNIANANGGASTGNGPTEACQGALVTPWLTIRTPASVHGTPSSGFMQIALTLNGAGAGATIDIAHPHMRKKVV